VGKVVGKAQRIGGKRLIVLPLASAPQYVGLRRCDATVRTLYLRVHDAIDDAVRKSIEQMALGTEERRPPPWSFGDLRDRGVYREDELPTETALASFVEARPVAAI
jgi:hypothetical protein